VARAPFLPKKAAREKSARENFGGRELRIAVAERAEQSGGSFERQRLRPNRRFHPAFGQSGTQHTFIVPRFQIIPESFALLSKAELQKGNKLGLRNSKRFQLRLDRNANHAGMNFRWRRKRPGGSVKSCSIRPYSCAVAESKP